MRALQAQHAEANIFTSAEPADALFDGDPGALPQPGMLPGAEGPHTPFVRGERKVGRNEPCPCGSGKKYQHCHGTPSNVG